MKKFVITAIGLALFFLTARAQEKGKFELGAILSPEVNLSTLSDSKFGSSSIETAAKIGYGLAGGIDVEYKLAPRFGIRVGGLLNVRNYRYEVSNLLFGTSFNPQTGEATPVTVLDNATLTFITLPLRGVYEIGGLWRLFAGANFSQRISDSRKRKVVDPAGAVEPLEQISTDVSFSTFSPVIGFGKRINGEKIAFEIMPYIERTTHRIEAPLLRESENQYNIGLGLNLRIK